MEIKVGCTGWSYEGWIGTFYPKKFSSSKFLKYYSRYFDITEINSTFYRIPSKHNARSWNMQTPPDFKFTAKFPQIITHEKKLENCEKEVDEFLESISPLGTKIISLVIQLPPSLTFDIAKPRLKKLLDGLPQRYLYPIDARHTSWFSKDATTYLENNNICLVWNDVKGVENPCPATSNYAYVRLIGDRTIQEKSFGTLQRDKSSSIKQWVKRLDSFENELDYAIIMANNHYEGFAPETANKILATLGLKETIWDSKKQQNIAEFTLDH
ncbi:MAG: DUF72 domain-containing protein [Nitrosopumilaceae archaeon]|nr:DUF72 domain-containing protein [Nitrosopumilaceae archaeon]NIU02481.1 DUF72 domain-containing protein [Nitrosopumilaceae archaeon]NIU88942.1 DUF72 domain-containing protein [Nitrosopumilaceae archaeon]NIV67053.1 DUF72 domain-containing protein [Nitrosopumilaceae archaeon]NIX63082.1 DUF72 domain-containing protein [Nitrosopumilaceae archaeon]